MLAEGARLNAALESLARAGRRGVRVAVAESVTCGALSAALGRGTSASSWFSGGIVAYHFDTKCGLLQVSPSVDPCSAECAEQMATTARRLLRADITVATTGVGGPEPVDGHAPGTVFLGWSDADGSGYQRLRLAGDPGSVISQTVERAATLLARLAEKRTSLTSASRL